SFSLASRCSLFCHELWFLLSVFYFLFNDSSTTEIYTLSLHDALPILLERERPLGDDRRVKSRARAVLAAACSIHFVHDGFSDILYVLLPIWANEFRLTFAQVGLIRTAYSGGMAAFQIPAGFLAERWGERRLLAAGTAITACGFIAAGAVGGFMSLLLVLLTAGLGSGVQHPLSSSLVSKAYETGPRRAALGT